MQADVCPNPLSLDPGSAPAMSVQYACDNWPVKYHENNNRMLFQMASIATSIASKSSF